MDRVEFKEGFAQLMASASRPSGNQGGIDAEQIGLGSQVGSKPKKREVTSEAAGAGLFLLAAAVALGLRRRARIS